ncbi:DnaJ sub C member 8 [Coemansia guatemalensis]|uniref:DnaJ sub C member 8 n=1 Tax=Coemansia guatemalensis TaxID=2761395 RepID=A0A9W8HUR6_9FUNG|nr:DnaJ sub C member 8 [Coemansia guatemalensis]
MSAKAEQITQEIRQLEVERVLKHSALDPFGILGVSCTCTPKEVKVAYRSKSLLIHPDKTAHEQARNAFEKLKKAEAELMDDEKRKSIQAMLSEARRELRAEWQKDVTEGRRSSDQVSEDSPEFEKAVMAKYRAIMIDIEWRRRQKLKQKMADEGRAAAKEEEAANEKRRKREAEKAWEDARDDRVNSWRSFQAKSKTKSKAKKPKKPKLSAS